MHVTLDHIEPIALHIQTFWFRPDQPVRYVAGQFTAITLPLIKPDERGTRHWFTISSSPTQPMIGVTTKFTPDNGSAFKDAMLRLKPGDRLILSEPMGDFVLPQDKSIPLLFIAGGIGITPMHSMIKWLSDKDDKRRNIHLVYSVRDEREMAFRNLFENQPIRFTPIVTEPAPNWSGETRPITATRIKELAAADSRTLIYLAGPEPMVEQFVDELQAVGIPYHHLVTDYFPGYKTI